MLFCILTEEGQRIDIPYVYNPLKLCIICVFILSCADYIAQFDDKYLLRFQLHVRYSSVLVLKSTVRASEPARRVARGTEPAVKIRPGQLQI